MQTNFIEKAQAASKTILKHPFSIGELCVRDNDIVIRIEAATTTCCLLEFVELITFEMETSPTAFLDHPELC